MLSPVLNSIADGSFRCPYCGEIIYLDQYHSCNDMKQEAKDRWNEWCPESMKIA